METSVLVYEVEMTLILTSIAPKIIVMTVDSVITNTFGDGNVEYETAPKIYPIQGIGCVATWGERVGNNLFRYLNEHDLQPKSTSIFEIREIVWQYLTQVYKPHEDNLGRVGYHISGFDHHGRPHHYHILWSPKSRNDDPNWEYQNHDCTPSPKTLRFDYDGRFNLAHAPISTIVSEVTNKENTGKARYDLTHRLGLIQFSDCVVRFVSEVTCEVGPPFYHYLISPTNNIEYIKHTALSPLKVDTILGALQKIDKEKMAV